MPQNSIRTLISAWENHIIEHHPRVTHSLPISQDDMIRLQALSEVYQLPLDDIIANLLTAAIDDLEAKMPYVEGKEVIRIEEGEPVYADIGITPAYLKAKKRLEDAVES